MKSIGKYNGFTLFEITNRDIAAFDGENSGYVLGDILGFTPDEEFPVLGYEEWVAGSKKEMQDFIDNYDKKPQKRVETKGKSATPDPAELEKENHCGYDILLRVKGDEKNSFVIAENKKAPNPFVAWQCKTDPVTGEKDYFWGKYTNTYLSALENLCNGILAWTRNSKISIEDPNCISNGVRTHNTKDVVVRGMGTLTTGDLEKLQNELYRFQAESKANRSFEPKDIIRDFLITSGYHTAWVTPFEKDPSQLGETDLLFNSRSGMFEHSDAWVVSTLNVLAEKKCEFAVTPDGVQMPDAASEVFNLSEARRAEQIVMGTYLKGQEQTLVNSTSDRVHGR